MKNNSHKKEGKAPGKGLAQKGASLLRSKAPGPSREQERPPEQYAISAAGGKAKDAADPLLDQGKQAVKSFLKKELLGEGSRGGKGSSPEAKQETPVSKNGILPALSPSPGEVPSFKKMPPDKGSSFPPAKQEAPSGRNIFSEPGQEASVPSFREEPPGRKEAPFPAPARASPAGDRPLDIRKTEKAPLQQRKEASLQMDAPLRDMSQKPDMPSGTEAPAPPARPIFTTQTGGDIRAAPSGDAPLRVYRESSLHTRTGSPEVRMDKASLRFSPDEALELRTYARQMQAREGDGIHTTENRSRAAQPDEKPPAKKNQPAAPQKGLPLEKRSAPQDGATLPESPSLDGGFTDLPQAENPSSARHGSAPAPQQHRRQQAQPGPEFKARGQIAVRDTRGTGVKVRESRENASLAANNAGAGLRTWEKDPLANSLKAQTKSAALHTGGQALQTSALQGVGAGAASAGAGAASGGATAAVEAGKKAADKIREMVENAARAGKQKAKKALSPLAAFLFVPLFFLLALGGAGFGGSASNVNLSEDVLSLMPQIIEACERHHIPEYAPLAAAVMMQESGGHADLVNGDVMQCAEGMGYPVHTPVPVEVSIDFGVSILAGNLRMAGSTGPADLPAISLALQGYNFGNGYITWALARGGYSKENAREFSIQQAAAHGWSGYGDIDYVDHVLRYYQINGGGAGMGDASAILGGFFAYPSGTTPWITYPGHEGIDIQAGEGQPVYACAPGVVSYAQGGWHSGMGVNGIASYGNCVFIDHGNGWQSRYAHMASITVASGTPVQQGQLIGYVGNTGNSFGAHLHLALYYNGSPSSGGVIYAEQAWPQYKS